MQEFEGSLAPFFAKTLLQKQEFATQERLEFLTRLMQTAQEGHLCYRVSQAPSFPESIVQEASDTMLSTPVIRQKDRYYLHRNWVYETLLISHIQRLRQAPPAFPAKMPPCDTLRTLQALAIERALSQAWTLIAGGPGTGKTYTASQLVRILSFAKPGLRVAISAPTGKAAFHLHSVVQSMQLDLQLEVMTLHRLLHVQPGQTRLFRGQSLPFDLVLVDEASMIEVPLFVHLLEAIDPSCTRLVLLGDPDQLPPVETGSIFSELAPFWAISLQEGLRTEKEGLQKLARAIRQGEEKAVFSLLKAEQEPAFFSDDFGSGLFQKVLSRLPPYLFSSRPDPQECLETLGRFRILGALRQGPFGVDALHRRILQHLAAQILPGQWWALPFLVTSNDPHLELFNGTSGVLIGQCGNRFDWKRSTAYFPQRSVSFYDLPSFELGFCLSIHKSQGGEFDHVWALFPEGSEKLGRSALYTAVTRARKGLELSIEERLLKILLQKASPKDSGVLERLGLEKEKLSSPS